MGSRGLMEEVKDPETVSADCRSGDSLVFVLFWLGSSMGVGETQKNVLMVRKAELINAQNKLVC